MPTLATDLRNKLERVGVEARDVAEAGACAALEAVAVHHHEPYGHMKPEQRSLRNKLRARARQLGDTQDAKGQLAIHHLAQECAYEHWHRMLFARFLAENHLLIEPDMGVAVSLEECKELAKDAKTNLWALAGCYARTMLPEIFRADDPVLQVPLAQEDQLKLEKLLDGLPCETFLASDSLGWCYQFWQSREKERVNKSGNKIGADELPAVTQLFTEDYMVDFLLDNTLGAWWAGKTLTAENAKNAEFQSEEEVRQFCALPGCPWKYLRFIKVEAASSRLGEVGTASSRLACNSKEEEKRQDAASTFWLPAAGTFDGWPKTAKELKCLDPCMGSGHFVVAMFERLVALRMAEEKLDEAAAVAAVIRDDLFGLEIDPRCTQIGAFNLAMAAWRRVGHRSLPAMNLACSGLAPNTREADWLAIAGDNEKLQSGMERLYRLFKDAPVLGSLIDPRAGEGDLLVAAFHELRPLLEKALAQETKDDTAHEMAVTARGLAKAAEILAGQFTLVATNVPYLGRGKQDDLLRDYCESVHPKAKTDLATCFVERSLEFCQPGGSITLVTPQNWWFLSSYADYRWLVLEQQTFHLLATLGEEAWQSFGDRGPMAALIAVSRIPPDARQLVFAIDALPLKTIDSKIAKLLDGELEEKHGRPFAIESLRAIQLSKSDVQVTLKKGRGQFTTVEWKDFLLRSIGPEPAAMSDRAKMVALLRMVPFVERNYNLVELGPRGTGKSHLFQQISPYSHLISGGKATVAKMFVNMSNGQRGLVCLYDVVCFDEVSGISFDQKDGVNILKGYMAAGEFSRGKDSIRASGGVVMVGNFDVDVEQQQRIGH